MLTTTDRYILRSVISITLVMTGVALIALLLERTLRLLDLVANPDKAFGYVSQMLVLLLPHYLGIALPAAFFFGVLLTYNRMNRENELVVVTAAGRGLHRLMASVMGLAVILAVIASIVVGFLQPYARYTYRALKQTVAHASLSAAATNGTFIHDNGLTFFADGASPGGERLNRIFVYEERDDGSTSITTGKEGVLVEKSDGGGSVLILRDGVRAEMRPDAETGGTLRFDELRWPIDPGMAGEFRARGKDERELTITELWQALANPPPKPKPREIVAELHSRLVTVCTILVLPLIAVPLALGGGRGGQTYGIAFGLLLLVVYQKILNFGEELASREILSVWIGLWLPFLALLAGGATLSYRAAFKVPRLPFGYLTSQISGLFGLSSLGRGKRQAT